VDGKGRVAAKFRSVLRAVPYSGEKVQELKDHLGVTTSGKDGKSNHFSFKGEGEWTKGGRFW